MAVEEEEKLHELENLQTDATITYTQFKGFIISRIKTPFKEDTNLLFNSSKKGSSKTEDGEGEGRKGECMRQGFIAVLKMQPACEFSRNLPYVWQIISDYGAFEL